VVVDASGRESQPAKWLDEWGFGEPATLSVKVDVGYATCVLERRPGNLQLDGRYRIGYAAGYRRTTSPFMEYRIARTSFFSC
jgi:hypothetical protein